MYWPAVLLASYRYCEFLLLFVPVTITLEINYTRHILNTKYIFVFNVFFHKGNQSTRRTFEVDKNLIEIHNSEITHLLFLSSLVANIQYSSHDVVMSHAICLTIQSTTCYKVVLNISVSTWHPQS